MLARRRLLLLCPLALLCVMPITADDGLDTARAAELRGNTEDAVELYLEWLEANPGEPNSPDVLIHAASLAATADEAILVLNRGLELIPAKSSAEVHERAASLEELVGRIDRAAAHHEAAGNNLAALALAYGMGEYESTAGRALAFYSEAPEDSSAPDFLALYGASLLASGRAVEARQAMTEHREAYADSSTPLFWLVMWDIGRTLKDTRLAGEARSVLNNEYPDSAALYLAENRILRWPTPGRISLGIIPEPVLNSVQVGAFLVRDSAAALRSSLEEDGFTAWIEQAGNYWKVLVNDPDGNTQGKLRDKGY